MVHLADAVRNILPGAAADGGTVELALSSFNFKGDVAVVTNEMAERHQASSTAGKAITVGDVAVVRKLAGAVAVRAGADFASGSHGLRGVRRLAPLG